MRRSRVVPRQSKSLELFGLAFPIKPCQFRHLPTIGLGRAETQLLLKRLLQHTDVSVLTKDERNDQPIVPGGNLAVGPVVSEKRAFFPARNVWRFPTVLDRLFKEVSSLVPGVTRSQPFSLADGFDSFADE